MKRLKILFSYEGKSSYFPAGYLQKNICVLSFREMLKIYSIVLIIICFLQNNKEYFLITDKKKSHYYNTRLRSVHDLNVWIKPLSFICPRNYLANIAVSVASLWQPGYVTIYSMTSVVQKHRPVKGTNVCSQCLTCTETQPSYYLRGGGNKGSNITPQILIKSSPGFFPHD